MPKGMPIVFGLIVGVFFWQMSATGAETSDQNMNQRGVNDASSVSLSLMMQQMKLNPLAFTENQGQWDENVLFRADAGGAIMWFARDGAYYQFTRRVPTARSVLEAVFGGDRLTSPPDRLDHEQYEFKSIMIKASFVGANSNPQMVGREMMGHKSNYFIGNDPDEWRTDVPNYHAVVYEDIYAGIDLKYFGDGTQMEYDFIVSPGADPSQIKIEYEGVKSLSVNDVGELVVETEWGTVTELKPTIYQLDGGVRTLIDGEYAIFADNTFGFELADNYDPALALVIDPVICYSTYLGGTSWDRGYAIAVDGTGDAFVTGKTHSSNFPTLSAYQGTNAGGEDVFVTKFHTSGQLAYSTYLGGSASEEGYGIALDGSSCALVTGVTGSTNFPTVGPIQTDQPGTDVFVTKLNVNGNGLLYSTYLGGSNWEAGYGIVTRWNGSAFDAYVTGVTASTNFPTVNPYQVNTDGYAADAFVSKLNSAGNALVYSTYLGGSSDDWGQDIAVENWSTRVWVTGYTYSTDFPTVNPYQTDMPGTDAFVTQLSSAGNTLGYSTYLGGNDGDYGRGIALSNADHVCVVGETWSTNFPTSGNAHQATNAGNIDAFLSTLGGYATYLGGSSADKAYGVDMDFHDNIYITGMTSSSNFPTRNPIQTDQPGDDAFIAKFDRRPSSPIIDSLEYSTYVGGNSDDQGRGIAVWGPWNRQNAYITGWTTSTNFPTKNAFQGTIAGDKDVFVTKIGNYLCGDADGNGIVEISDAVHLINYVFVPGSPAPDPMAAGDVDCNTIVEISDAVLLISYVFVPGSPEPCDPDGDGVPDC